MRAFIFGLMVLPLAACSLHIGEVTDSASASATDTGASVSSTGQPTTTEAPGTGTESASSGTGNTGTTGPGTTGPGSTGEGTEGSSGDVSSTGVGTDDSGTSAGTGVATDMGGAKVADATIEDSCAPDDGPALELHLILTDPVCGAQWSGDVVRVALFQGGPLAPGTYPLAGGLGFAWWQQEGQPEEVSNAGAITIDAWDGGAVTGFFTLTFANAVLEGDFAGPYCPGGGFCG